MRGACRQNYPQGRMTVKQGLSRLLCLANWCRCGYLIPVAAMFSPDFGLVEMLRRVAPFSLQYCCHLPFHSLKGQSRVACCDSPHSSISRSHLIGSHNKSTRADKLAVINPLSDL